MNKPIVVYQVYSPEHYAGRPGKAEYFSTLEEAAAKYHGIGVSAILRKLWIEELPLRKLVAHLLNQYTCIERWEIVQEKSFEISNCPWCGGDDHGLGWCPNSTGDK